MVLKMAEDLMKHMKNEMKRSYTLTKTQAANPKGLGAKPRKTGYSASVYPTLPTTLEETVASVPNRTETWVQETKQTPDKALNVGIKAEKNPKDDATGQPPDQRSARVSKKSRSRQLLPSLGKSRSRKTLNCNLGKVSVSRDLKICSLEKSRSRRNRKFESRKSLGLDNFH